MIIQYVVSTDELFFSMKNRNHVDVNNEEFQKVMIERFKADKEKDSLNQAILNIWEYLSFVVARRFIESAHYEMLFWRPIHY